MHVSISLCRLRLISRRVAIGIPGVSCDDDSAFRHRGFSAIASGSAADAALADAMTKLDIRIGKIVEVAVHPTASGLYVEKIDMGLPTGMEDSGASAPQLRTIVSGLVQFCSIESLMNRKVVVVCNLKPRDFKGITSHGMLLCSSNAEHSKVEPIVPPTTSQAGDIVSVEGLPAQVPCEVGNKASKLFAKIADSLFVDDLGVATFRGQPLVVASGGSITSSLLKAKIS